MPTYTLYRAHKIAYDRRGSGEKAVVFLHGFCEDRHLWAQLAGALAPAYTTLCVDLPGFGDSDLIEPYSMELLAQAVSAVLDAEGIELAVWVGHSMGGYAVLAALELQAERLAGLCLLHSHPFADSQEKRVNRLKAIGFIQKNGVVPFVRHLFGELFAPDFLHSGASLVQPFIERCAGSASQAVIAASRAMLQRPDRSTCLAEARVPALFVLGEQDASIPLDTGLKACTLSPRSIIRILPGVGHMSMLEAPEACLEALDLLLKQAVW